MFYSQASQQNQVCQPRLNAAEYEELLLSGGWGELPDSRLQQSHDFVIPPAHIGEKVQTFDRLIKRHKVLLLYSQLPGVAHVLKISFNSV